MSDINFNAPAELPEELKGISIKDTSNPRSVVNITPSSMSTAIMKIPDQVFAMGEEELTKLAKVGTVENRLRLSFWREYDQAQIAQRRINLSNVYSGVCTQAYFLRYVVANSFKLAYVLTPPIDYEIQIQELLNKSLEQALEIISLPNLKKNGEVDAKLAHVKIMILESALMRAKGAIPYKMETKNLNVNVDTKGHQLGASKLPTDPDEIERKLAELDAQVNGREVIDVDSKEVIEIGPKSKG